MASKLRPDALKASLARLDGWSVKKGALHKEYAFASFVDAFGFMASVALCAEAANHHPDWSNAYGAVRVDLSTHDAGGITEKDVALATQMERLAARFAKKPTRPRAAGR